MRSHDGLSLIYAERKRQLEEEGYDVEHDDAHDYAELAYAAAAYAVGPTLVNAFPAWTDLWPWPLEEWKNGGERIQHLARAGALIAAEIDRLQRAKRDDPAAHAIARELLHQEHEGWEYDLGRPAHWEHYDRAAALLEAARPHLEGSRS